jgi:integrase
MKANREKLTAGRIDSFECEEGKTQSFLWDSHAPGLAVRATKTNKAYIFQSRLKSGESVRLTIGDCRVWGIEEARDKAGEIIKPGARQEAARLQAIIDQGDDPRQARADKAASAQAKRQASEETARAAQDAERRGRVTLAEAWEVYCKARKSATRNGWSARHAFDHEKVMRPERTKESGRQLKAGVLASLAPLPLSHITAERVAAWLDEETPRRGTQAALAFRLLRAFLSWCDGQPDYRGIAAPDACASKVSKAHVKKASAKDDALQREMLRRWFEAVRKIKNPAIAAYLQCLLLLGARREELACLRWADVDFEWDSLTIRDKAESKGGQDGKRTIPMTPYVKSLLLDLKNRNQQPPTVRRLKTLEARGEKWEPSEWVFSSKTSETGKLQEPGIAHRKALAAAGLPAISLHGLRRSFGSLSEWCEVPIGIVAQIQGHKPSATAEKHYRVRPLDLLRLWHAKIEAWILEQACIIAPPAAQEMTETSPAALSVIG